MKRSLNFHRNLYSKEKTILLYPPRLYVESLSDNDETLSHVNDSLVVDKLHLNFFQCDIYYEGALRFSVNPVKKLMGTDL